MRLAEFGSCHRNEPSGSLHGIMRVRSFTQDDGHIFCTEGSDSARGVRSLSTSSMRSMLTLALDEIIYRLSTRPEQRVGSDEDWDRAEEALAKRWMQRALPGQELPGEGAFYGPKIEFSLKDCIGRVWQWAPCRWISPCPAVSMRNTWPKMAAQSTGDVAPGISGFFERFIGILIEQYEGAFPFWLAPEQARCDEYYRRAG